MILSNMVPCSPIGNVIDCRVGTSKNRCDCIARPKIFFKRANFQNIILCENRSWMCASNRSYSGISSFFYHINSVISHCSNKEMGWSHASRIIAFVTNTLSFGNFPIGNLPSHTMSRFPFPAYNVEFSIAAVRHSGHPNPTPITLFNFIPESFHVWNL